MQVERLITVLTVLGCLAVLSLPDKAQGKSQTLPLPAEVVDEWVHKNYAAVRRNVLPDRLELSPFPADTKWIVVVVVDEPFRAGEYWFSVTKKYDGSAKATVRIPHGAPLAKQIKELKETNPAATVETISKLVRIDEYSISDTQLAELRNLANSFEQITISPVMPDLLGLDLFEYRFWTESQYGQQMSAQLVGFGPGAKKQPHALVAWVERFRTVTRSYFQRVKVPS